MTSQEARTVTLLVEVGVDRLQRSVVEALDCDVDRSDEADPQTLAEGSDLRVWPWLETHGAPRMRRSVATVRRRLVPRCGLPSTIRERLVRPLRVRAGDRCCFLHA